MTQLNLNNLLMLYELRHQAAAGDVNAITLNGETTGVVSGNSILPLIACDTYELLGKILLSDTDIAVVTYMQNSASMFDYAADMNYVIPTYLSSLSIKSFSGLGFDNIQLTFKRSLDYQECRIYLSNSDIVLGPFLYQWLDDYFAHTSLNISFPVIYSGMKDKVAGEYGEEKLFLLILALAGLGFIKISHNLPANTNAHKCNHMVAIPDKLSVAVFIADNFKKNNHIISMRSKYVAFSYDFTTMNEMDIKKETTDEFMFNILANQVTSGMMQPDKPEGQASSFNRLELFAKTKLLPTDLFENEFEDENLQYRYSLIDDGYINHLPGLIASGIDIVDMSVLSLLQTKKMSTAEMLQKTNFPPADLNRSLFGLIILGIISASQEIELPVKRNTDASSNRDNLRKIVDKVNNI